MVISCWEILCHVTAPLLSESRYPVLLFARLFAALSLGAALLSWFFENLLLWLAVLDPPFAAPFGFLSLFLFLHSFSFSLSDCLPVWKSFSRILSNSVSFSLPPRSFSFSQYFPLFLSTCPSLHLSVYPSLVPFRLFSPSPPLSLTLSSYLFFSPVSLILASYLASFSHSLSLAPLTLGFFPFPPALSHTRSDSARNSQLPGNTTVYLWLSEQPNWDAKWGRD